MLVFGRIVFDIVFKFDWVGFEGIFEKISFKFMVVFDFIELVLMKVVLELVVIFD